MDKTADCFYAACGFLYEVWKLRYIAQDISGQ